MNLHVSRGAWTALRHAWGLGAMTTAFFLVMVVFILGNGLSVYVVLSGYRGAVHQIMALDELRVLGQRLAVQAMRLSDGSAAPMAQLSRDIDAVNNTLHALDQGGVVAGRTVPALASAAVRDHLPQFWHSWGLMRSRLQSVILGSYSQAVHEEPANSLSRLQRQWIADDARQFLDSLDAGASVLAPRQLAARDRAMTLGVVLVLADLLFLLLLFLWLRRRVVQPLQGLDKVGRGWIAGHFDRPAQLEGAGELATVARGLDAGAVQLRQLMDRIREEHARLERSDIIFQGLALNSLVGIFLVEAERFSFVSDKMAEIFGYVSSEMTGALLLSVIVSNERYLVAEAIKASQARKDGTLRIERHGQRKDGGAIDIEMFGTTITVDGKVSLIGLVQDVTERKQAESSAQLAAIAYENSSEAIAITDASGVIIDVNPAYSRMTGYWADEVAGQTLPLLQPGRHNRDFYDGMWHAINTRGRWDGEYWGQRKSGEDYAERVVVDTAWNHDGSVNCRVAMLSDVTEKKQVEAQIWHQAHHDPLTGLPNRQYFNERLRAAVELADKSHEPLALLFLDLDLFKEVNDSMGHDVGDSLLVEVARRLETCTAGDTCFVARLGGDEFVLISCRLPERARVDALCRRILEQITTPYLIDGRALRVSASLGVALYPQDAEDAETLLRHVDMAMYVAKGSGRNRYHYFDVSMRERVRMQRDLLYSLPQAIAAGQFFLLYQPIYSLATGELVKAEILLRWRHPEFGVISPLDFIPYAEERHLIRPLGDWVFSQAAQHLACWRTHSPQLRLTMNVAPSQLAEDGINLDAVLGMLGEHGLPPDSLSLECSEHLFLNMDAEVRTRMQRMSQAGMRFSVGAVSLGMSALLAMQHQPFETLKLEREATEQLLASGHASVVCEAIIALAHRLGLSVTAEGITTPQQYEFLRGAGCDAGQGYWLDEPLDQTVFEARLAGKAHRPVAAEAPK